MILLFFDFRPVCVGSFAHDGFQIGGRQEYDFSAVTGKPGFKIKMLGIILCQHAVISRVERHCGGKHHKHTRCENRNRGKPHGVLLHAVKEPADSRHVLWTVVEFLVFPEHFQHEYAASDKEKVGSDNNQKHRHKKEHERVERRLRGNCQIITRSQGDDSQNQHYPLDFRLPLPCRAALQKLHRLHQSDADSVEQEDEEIKRKKETDCRNDGERRDIIEPRHRVCLKQPADQQRTELIENHARKKSADNGAKAADEIFKEKHPSDMALFHAQHIINAKFPFALLHQESVDVEHQHRRKKSENGCAHPHEDGQIRTALDMLHSAVHRQRQHDV